MTSLSEAKPSPSSNQIEIGDNASKYVGQVNNWALQFEDFWTWLQIYFVANNLHTIWILNLITNQFCRKQFTYNMNFELDYKFILWQTIYIHYEFWSWLQINFVANNLWTIWIWTWLQIYFVANNLSTYVVKAWSSLGFFSQSFWAICFIINLQTRILP